jgi:predicted nucleic acid-binding protein
MRAGEYTVSSQQIMTLVAQSPCSAYDCEFVALAMDLQVPLVTVDQQILGSFPTRSVSLSGFVHPDA